ncbi:spore germination protein [Anaeromicrobium sediminis]|uniref:Spore germination protein n=1 Tax=Anaeromicrobium sediminis TaxID=1478221 RepID=A0A267MHS6_9FIRM|nr:spore germination protein [Anaeromicrobium sediminis]PAB59134.1 hypothetical protein CCE28_11490 [Anaeromicrobium sediminis]
MNTMALTKDLEKNIALISSNSPANFNFKTRELLLKDNTKCIVLYISGLSKKEDIEDRIIYPLLFKIDCDINTLSSPISYISQRYITISDTKISSDINSISESLKNGETIILIENEESAVICNTSTSNFKKVANSKIEETIRGEKSAFVEILSFNIGLIQEKLKNNNLIIEKYVFGEENNSEAALLYMKDAIDINTLNKLKSKLKTIKTSYIPDTGYLAQFIDKSPISVFPQSKTTEKPDKVVSDILQGKAAILINGCSYALILPVVYIEFFQGFEDYSNRIILANFDRFTRILAAAVVVTLSPIYLVLLKYNAELVPLDLIKIIIMSRRDIPLPPFLEILLMEMIIEFLREGGLRLPSIVGQTLSIVGGIILGQAAIQAGIVSPTTLIIVAVSVIATFLIPNYEMSLSIRLLRFYVLILAQILGFFGVIIGLFSIIAHLMSLESLGTPYFSPFAPMRYKGLKDSLARYPLKDINRIPVIFKRRKVKK